MKRFQKIYLTLGTVGALLAFSGCSDEIQTPDYNKEGITGISLHIPDVDGAAQFGRTRGEEFITRAGEAAAEGKINEIWLFAYSTTDPNNKVIEPLSLDNMTVVSNTYRKANIELRPDTYKFYVVANLSNYLPTGKLSSTLSESDLKGLVLNFDKDSKELSLNNGLPMACMNDKIKVGNDVASATVVTSGEVEIGAGACPKLVADMTFLCSKVRYTILHDRESFSSAFGQSEFDVTGSKVANISNATKWNGATGSDYSAPFDLSLDSPLAKVYPTDFAQLKSDGMQLTAFSVTKDVKGKQ
ncbi:MAG: hypothetical protein K2K58_00395, partial [Muribaculaceae bacterium]|nr:hypothetical protein [Muribaculaceae bacterium]